MKSISVTACVHIIPAVMIFLSGIQHYDHKGRSKLEQGDYDFFH